MTKWTTAKEELLIDLYNEGHKTKVIAGLLELPVANVSSRIYTLQRTGVVSKRFSKAKEEEKLLINMREKLHMGIPDNKLNYTPVSTKIPISRVVESLPKIGIVTDANTGKTGVKNVETMDELKLMLLDKNANYGDSALNPIRIFSKADTTEQIKVRIDDKLNRLMQGNDILETDEDVIKDLIGYLALLLINMRE